MRGKFLNETLFFGLDRARSVIAAWVDCYKDTRPHSALGFQTPAAYAAQLAASGQLSRVGSDLSWMKVGDQRMRVGDERPSFIVRLYSVRASCRNARRRLSKNSIYG
jgi:hypothetical protein